MRSALAYSSVLHKGLLAAQSSALCGQPNFATHKEQCVLHSYCKPHPFLHSHRDQHPRNMQQILHSVLKSATSYTSNNFQRPLNNFPIFSQHHPSNFPTYSRHNLDILLTTSGRTLDNFPTTSQHISIASQQLANILSTSTQHPPNNLQASSQQLSINFRHPPTILSATNLQHPFAILSQTILSIASNKLSICSSHRLSGGDRGIALLLCMRVQSTPGAPCNF